MKKERGVGPMSQAVNNGASPSGGRFRRPRTWRNAVEGLIPKILLVCALLSVITTFAILLTLLFETASFFE
jgi:phosphate transport system permease protein